MNTSYLIKDINLGANIIRPTMAEPIANTRTPPAEISFDLLASLFIWGMARLTAISMAVLNNSPPITMANQLIHTIHSHDFSFNIIPKTITIVATVIWILRFLSVLKALFKPAKAYLKLLIKFYFSLFLPT